MKTAFIYPLIIAGILSLSQGMTGSAISGQNTLLAQAIVSFWETSLSGKLDLVIYDSASDYWYVNRIALVNQSFEFETIGENPVARSNQLIIRFSYNRWDNRFSPNANSKHPSENRIWGFESMDEAKANTRESDFKEADYSYVEKISREMQIVYLLKNNAWVLAGGNDLFEEYIGQYVSDTNNAQLFADVLSVPVK